MHPEPKQPRVRKETILKTASLTASAINRRREQTRIESENLVSTSSIMNFYYENPTFCLDKKSDTYMYDM